MAIPNTCVSNLCKYYTDHVRDREGCSNFFLQTVFIRPVTAVIMEVFALATLVEGAVRSVFALLLLPITFILAADHPLQDWYHRQFSLENPESETYMSFTLFLPYLTMGIVQGFVPKMKPFLT